MRTKRATLIVALLMLLPALAGAQQPQPSTDFVPVIRDGWIDFGVRGSDIQGDAARFQRFRDLGDGAFVETVRFDGRNGTYLLELGADKVGREDQRYFAEYRNRGNLHVSFLYDQIPLFISQDTRTAYRVESPGVLRLDDALQQGIQDRSLTLADVAAQSIGFETRNRRDIAALNVTARPATNLDLIFDLKSAKREGTMPLGASFGFSADVEVAAPIDTRTTDLRLGAEWAKQGNLLRVSYDGSWFNNDIQTLVWDSPFKFTDSTNPSAYSAGNGTSQGRYALWPSNTAHTVSAAGAVKMPAKSRLFGHVAIGTHQQNETILPHTINTAITPIPLERNTAEAEVQTVAANLRFTSRPTQLVSFEGQYRYYDWDNRTPHFAVDEYVRLDQVPEPLASGGPEPYSITRQDASVSASFRVVPYSSLKVGYARNNTDRTFRIFGTTTEDRFTASFDTTGNQYVTFRTTYEYATREGSHLEPHVLEIVGEQPGLRHYDVANRDRSRVTALVTYTPIEIFGINASIAAGKDDYKDSEFGLRDNDHRVYSIGFDAAPRDEVLLGISYSYENYMALQNSRSANPGAQFVDPTRDWSIDSDDKVHSIYGSVDLLKLIPDVELRMSYDYNQSRSVYLYGGRDGSALSPVFTGVQQLPPVTNELHQAILDGRYFLSEHVAIGLAYWYENYDVNDYALGAGTVTGPAMPGALLLNYLYRPYTAHTGWFRVMYLW